MANNSGDPFPASFPVHDRLNMPMITKFKIGICQISVSDSKSNNIERARSAIQVAAKQGARLVILPEMWNCPYSTDYFSKFAEDFDDKDAVSPSISMMSEIAYSQRVILVGGSIPEKSGNQLYNTCFVFGVDGELMAKHRKIHLFDVDIPGDICFKESDTFAAGERPTVVDTVVGRVGIGICHDLRFPELAMLYQARGAHLICFPGAFNMSTGESLWELEQRARAADNQLFVTTCSPSRESAGSYLIWGHSTLVGPMGEVIGTCADEEKIIIAEIDYIAIEKARKNLPFHYQKRADIYNFIDLNK